MSGFRKSWLEFTIAGDVEGEELWELVLLDKVSDGDDSANVLEEFLELVLVIFSDDEVLVGALLVDCLFSSVVEEVRLEVVIDATLKGLAKLPGLHLVHVEELK